MVDDFEYRRQNDLRESYVSLVRQVRREDAELDEEIPAGTVMLEEEASERGRAEEEASERRKAEEEAAERKRAYKAAERKKAEEDAAERMRAEEEAVMRQGRGRGRRGRSPRV